MASNGTRQYDCYPNTDTFSSPLLTQLWRTRYKGYGNSRTWISSSPHQISTRKQQTLARVFSPASSAINSLDHRDDSVVYRVINLQPIELIKCSQSNRATSFSPPSINTNENNDPSSTISISAFPVHNPRNADISPDRFRRVSAFTTGHTTLNRHSLSSRAIKLYVPPHGHNIHPLAAYTGNRSVL